MKGVSPPSAAPGDPILGGVGWARAGGCVGGALGKGREKGEGGESLRLAQGAAAS